MPDSQKRESGIFYYQRKETIMIAIISNGVNTANVQLPVGRKQLAGALSYLGADHESDYDLKYNEENKDGLMFTLDCRGVVENAIVKALPTGFSFHTLNDTLTLMNDLPYGNRRGFHRGSRIFHAPNASR